MLVATPQMRKRTGLVYFSWLVVAMVYYGRMVNNIFVFVYFSLYLYLYLYLCLDLSTCLCICIWTCLLLLDGCRHGLLRWDGHQCFVYICICICVLLIVFVFVYFSLYLYLSTSLGWSSPRSTKVGWSTMSWIYLYLYFCTSNCICIWTCLLSSAFVFWIVYFSWPVVAMVYYGPFLSIATLSMTISGLSFNTKNIGADIYVR